MSIPSTKIRPAQSADLGFDRQLTPLRVSGTGGAGLKGGGRGKAVFLPRDGMGSGMEGFVNYGGEKRGQIGK